jgi:hypothetical protein
LSQYHLRCSHTLPPTQYFYLFPSCFTGNDHLHRIYLSCWILHPAFWDS